MENFKPKIVGFLCNWCTYAAADLAGASRKEINPSLNVVRVMCTSRIDQNLLLNTYFSGADGILVAGWHPGDCHYQVGNYHTRRRIAIAKKIFDTLGLENDRLRLTWISASEGNKFAQVGIEFTKQIVGMGENPTKKHIFL